MKLVRSQTWWAIGIMVATTLFLFGPIFRGDIPLPVKSLSTLMTGLTQKGTTSIFRDSLVQAYPYHVFTTESFKRGDFPFWNDLIFTGTPFFANGQSGVLSPLKALWWWLPPSMSYILVIVLELVVAGVGMYVLTKGWKWRWASSMIAALTFAFSGPLVLWSTNIGMGSVVIWLPWMLWAVHRLHAALTWKWVGITAALSAAMLISGQVQIAFLTLMFASLWALAWWSKKQWQRRTIMFGVSLLIGIGLSAVVLLPTWEATQQAYRQPATLTWSSVLKPSKLFDLNTKNIRALGTLVSPTLLGSEYHYRGPANFIEGNLFIGPLAVLLVIASLVWWKRKLWRWAVVGAGLVTLVIVFPGWWNLAGKVFPWLTLTPVWRLSFFLVFCLSILAGLGAQVISSRLQSWRGWALIGLVVVITLWQWQGILPFGPRSELYATSPILQRAKPLLSGERLWTPDSGLDQFMPYDIPIVGGYDSLYPKTYMELWQANSTLTKKNQIVARDVHPNLLAASAGNVMLTSGPVPAGWLVVDQERQWTVSLRDQRQFPWHTVTNLVMSAEADLGSVDLTTTAVVEREIPDLDQLATSEVTLIHQTSTISRARVSSTGRSLLVTPLQWYPGWQVLVNEQPQEMLRVNHAFIGAVIPAGEHAVRIEYRPVSVTVGILVSGACALLTLTLLFGRLFRKQDTPQA